MTPGHAHTGGGQTQETSLFGAPWKQAVAGVVLAAWVYFIGWIYFYFYLRFFHIDIFELDIPLEYIVVQAITPVEYAVWQDWPVWVPIAVAAAVGFVSLRRCRLAPVVRLRGFLQANWDRLKFPLATAGVVALYVVGFKVATAAALDRAQEVWTSDAPEIQFTFADDEKNALEKSKLGASNQNYALRYLLATKDFYYVFIAEQASTANYVPDGLVFKIRSDAVNSVWIRRRGGSLNAM